jgi:hypothetical protein
MQQLSIHMRKFNEKLQVMNQSNSRQLMLSAEEARALQADIFTLLANFAELASEPVAVNTSEIVQISMDGGAFK